MEVSSHALALHRVDGTRFAVSVFTNLSRDHLDFHPTMSDYFQAKARLFTPDLTERAVVNLDDPYGHLLSDAASVPTVGYTLDDAREFAVDAVGSRFRWRGVELTVPIGGRFNVSNALAAATAAGELGVDPEIAAVGLAAAGPVRGRFELVDAGQPFQVIVDYAHTPDGLDQLLGAAREVATPGRVIVVFGAGGDRDPTKRSAMGEVAARQADRVVLTSDNPRGEDPGAIIAAVKQGVHDVALTVEPDRRLAIALALADARPGDVVVIAGKGHETTQTIGDRGAPLRRPGRCPRAAGGPGVVALLLAAGIALLISLVGTRFAIDWLRAHGIGQFIREDAPSGHVTKAGTPTMGGVTIVVGAAIGYTVAHLRSGLVFTRSGLLVLAVILGASVVGAVDDWLAIKRARNLGLNKRAKILGLLGVAITFVTLAYFHTPVHTALSFTRIGSVDIDLGAVGWGVLGVLLILGLQQRREPHRRTRRAGGRLVDVRVRRLHRHRVLGVPPPRGVPAAARARRCRRVGGDARRVHRVPVVERRPRPHLHG